MALALLVFTVGTAAAETYIEGYIGNNFTVTAPNPIEIDANPLYRGPTKLGLEYPRTVASNLTGGLKLGTWFSHDGFPHVDYPDWMKYTGFYLDFNYHDFYYLSGIGSRRMQITPSPGPEHFQNYKMLGNGNIFSVGFMFALRYGFHPTEKVPFGKLQPYLAVGPAIMVTTLGPTMEFQPNGNYEYFVAPYGNLNIVKGSSQSIVSLALETEMGLRYMLTKFLSIDTSVKYRYSNPSTTYDLNINGFTHQLHYSPQLNLFSIQAGVAYHF